MSGLGIGGGVGDGVSVGSGDDVGDGVKEGAEVGVEVFSSVGDRSGVVDVQAAMTIVITMKTAFRMDMRPSYHSQTQAPAIFCRGLKDMSYLAATLLQVNSSPVRFNTLVDEMVIAHIIGVIVEQVLPSSIS